MSKPVSSIRKFLNKLAVPFFLFIFLCLFLTAYLYPRMFINIETGHAGVIWKRFQGGTDIEKLYEEGFHFIWPWDRIQKFDVRLLTTSNTFNALSNDGLHLDINISVRYRINSHKLGLLYKNVGTKYIDVLLMPEVQSFARLIFAKYNSEQIYSENRTEIQAAIKEAVVEEIEVRHTVDSQTEPFLYVQDVLIESVVLPKTLRHEIEKKVAQKHLMLSYEYRLKREKLESQRKEIEALGIRKFQDTVRDGITDRYLRWKGIDATLALASSNNAKVVVIGAGDEGLPLILGNMGGDAPVNAPTAGNAASSASSKTLQQQLDDVTEQSLNSLLFDTQKANAEQTASSPSTQTPSASASTTPTAIAAPAASEAAVPSASDASSVDSASPNVEPAVPASDSSTTSSSSSSAPTGSSTK
ncbi:MAG: prohibitin family protein [Arenicella sp.]